MGLINQSLRKVEYKYLNKPNKKTFTPSFLNANELRVRRHVEKVHAYSRFASGDCYKTAKWTGQRGKWLKKDSPFNSILFVFRF